jgi:hypothetical protein
MKKFFAMLFAGIAGWAIFNKAAADKREADLWNQATMPETD